VNGNANGNGKEAAMKIDVSKIQSVYSGKDGSCCCGCAGKHYYASASRAEASKARGYEISDDEVSDRMVRKVARIIGEAAEVEQVSDDCIAVVVGERVYIAYMSEPIEVVDAHAEAMMRFVGEAR
jgi:hypothetical protein